MCPPSLRSSPWPSPPDPSLRSPAERAIHTHLTHHPSPFILALTSLLSTTSDEPIRSLSSILLRTKLTAGEPPSTTPSPLPLQSHLRATLLHCLLSDPSRACRLLHADTVAELASTLLYKGEWDELVPFLASLLSHPDPSPISLALTILSQLTDTLDTLLPHLPTLSPLLAHLLHHPSPSVQTHCITTLCKLIPILEDPTHRREHAKAFPLIHHTLLSLLVEGREEEAVKVVGGLVEMVGEGEGDGALMKGVMDRYALLMACVVCRGTPVAATLPSSFPPPPSPLSPPSSPPLIPLPPPLLSPPPLPLTPHPTPIPLPPPSPPPPSPLSSPPTSGTCAWNCSCPSARTSPASSGAPRPSSPPPSSPPSPFSSPSTTSTSRAGPCRCTTRRRSRSRSAWWLPTAWQRRSRAPS